MKRFCLFALLLVSTLTHALQLNLYFTNGNRESFDLTQIRKTTFTAGDMNLMLKDGTTYTWSLSSLDYYHYDDVSGTEPILPSIGEVSLFPNPSKGAPAISFSLSKSTEVRWELVNANGQVLASRPFGKLQEGSHQFQLKKEVPELPAGTYTFRMSTPEVQVVRPFIAE